MEAHQVNLGQKFAPVREDEGAQTALISSLAQMGQKIGQKTPYIGTV